MSDVYLAIYYVITKIKQSLALFVLLTITIKEEISKRL